MSELHRIDAARELLPDWALDGRLPQPAGYAEEAFQRLVILAERGHAAREGLLETPQRAARAWAELTCGYASELDLKTFDSEGCDEIVAVKDIPFHSLCEHHCLPFFGTVDFAYLPGRRILGLSKFARLADHYSRRLQVQERLTKQMADTLEDALTDGDQRPGGVLVRVRAQHLCMSMRGVQKLGAQTVTCVTRGRFRENAATRAEALELLR